MIRRLRVKSFKSLEDVDVELGLVNVFIGANGSGKSNLLEALGVLSAAADGKVNDQTLKQRGVRPGVPSLYKSSFREGSPKSPQEIFLRASGDNVSYQVSLDNVAESLSTWMFTAEHWERDGHEFAERGSAINPEQGLAALKAVDHDRSDPALQFLRAIQNYVIYSPTTSVLRGTAIEPEPREPIGLSGGRLPQAINLVRMYRHSSASEVTTHYRRVIRESLELIDWAQDFRCANTADIPLSPSAASSPLVVKFVDRFMSPGRNVLSGFDASEGALYVLFLAVVAAHPATPAICAVDNADHGLNPRLARSLMSKLCGWYLDAPLLPTIPPNQPMTSIASTWPWTQPRQILLTTHNPLVLDGLPLMDERVRLFAVSRTNQGHTTVQRIEVTESLQRKAQEGWTLSRLWVMGHLGGVPDV